MRGLSRTLAVAALLALGAGGAPAGPAAAAEWNGIDPGVTKMGVVRERLGAPSKESKQKVNNYDTVEWTYEGDRAVPGFHRVVVDFGILLPSGYSPDTVRVVRLDPKRFIYTKDLVVAGWGEPDRAGTQNERDVFFYRSGLLVTFDEQGVMATSLFFTVKQPDPDDRSAPTRAPARPPSAPGPGAPPAQGTPPVRR
ncbi:MAG TPA: hypothetical protein VJU81_03700 [Methylomirabilota bacterium]|nr:hypothetical protein [Methylomirabilota bacterium]